MADEMHAWENVWSDAGGVPTQHTFRMRVPGGWLYRHNAWRPEGDVESMVFVPEVLAPADRPFMTQLRQIRT